MKLQNKVTVITGGTSGIGLAIAKEYQREGAKVVVMGRNADALSAASAELGDGALVLKGDVTKATDLENLYTKTTARFGKVDVLVANAGIIEMGPLGGLDEASFDRMSAINFKGAYYTVEAALPYLTDGGSVIITGSAVSGKPMPGMSVYAATKAAVRSLVRTFAAELAPRGVRVNVLSPGPIETPIFGKLGLPEDQMGGMAEQITSMVPLGRFGSGDEMAKAALFLGSDDSSFVTGSDLVADGGFAS